MRRAAACAGPRLNRGFDAASALRFVPSAAGLPPEVGRLRGSDGWIQRGSCVVLESGGETMTRFMAIASGLAAVSWLSAGAAVQHDGDHSASRSVRLTTPRIPPVAESRWSAADRELAKSYTTDGGAGN